MQRVAHVISPCPAEPTVVARDGLLDDDPVAGLDPHRAGPGPELHDASDHLVAEDHGRELGPPGTGIGGPVTAADAVALDLHEARRSPRP